ncbi:thioredoxin family protein [Halobacillus sp. Marseille-Q1614]|uniref:thioredoxin family protein n=1 Tax=Halobacillus sp. Marseille-Q1614 TaxID=2709134 RepID=UPI00157119FE|nr:thioredoxin family protein [Halobacillus sp. Marseille-Q1614]
MREFQNREVTEQLKTKGLAFTYIYTPFCGTCHLARKMLETIETTIKDEVFLEMNASLYPEFMQEYQVKSVPCLLITNQAEVIEKVYAFHSVPHMYEKVQQYL